jgi:DNA-binding CsgD family transcriptional regulator
MAETARGGVATAGRVAASSQALLVVDEAAVCQEASLGACRLLGVGRGEVVGRAVEDLLELDSRDRFNHVWQAFRASGGHAEPFVLDAPATALEVGVTVIAGVLPDRHLIRFDPVTPAERPVNHVAEAPAPPAAPAPQHRPPDGRAPGSPAPRGPTAREREVLALLAGGATDGQIATMLELSPATVQTHVRNAKAKLGARTRAQAVALAIQRALITPR